MGADSKDSPGLLHSDAYLDWWNTERIRLKQLSDMHMGQDCFIVGNGPSLNEMDLEKLNDFHVFGLNKIFLIFDRVDLRLGYHVSTNPLVMKQSKQAFEKLNCTTFLPFDSSRAFVGDHIYRFYKNNGQVSFGTFLEPMYEGYTVTYMAMQIAFSLGFERVFLVGVDHNFKVAGTPNEKQILDGPDKNHFDPRYFQGQEWHLPDLVSSEFSYRMAKFCYERVGRKIFDATVNGKLNIFQKMEFTEALQTARKKDAG